MRFFTLAATIFLLWSCEWAPEQVAIDQKTHYLSMNIALGDTLELQIAGHDLSIEKISTPDVIALELLDSGRIEIAGIGLGETQLTIRYLLPLVEGSAAEASAVTYVDLIVTDGIPLDLILGELQLIYLTDYLLDDQLEQLDSIWISLPAGPVGEELDLLIGSSTVSLTSNRPGVQRVEIIMLDSLGAQIVPLIFETQTSIRKIVLTELFTNAGCVNCPVANENIDHLSEEYAKNFAVIRYHVFWTDPADPMNLYNPTQVEDRRVFYGGSWEAPRLVFEGVPGANYSSLESLIIQTNQALDGGSDIHIWKPELVHSTDSVFIDFRIQNFGSTLNDLICWSVLTEDSVYYPGTNGEENHMQVMRDMIATEVSHIDDEVTLQHSLKLPPAYAVTETFHLVTFLQDLTTKKILQTSNHSILDLSISVD